MENLDERLKKYEIKCDELKNKEFSSFEECETEYCALINEGGAIRKDILDNPSQIDKKSLLVLTNQIQNISFLDNKYMPLLNILKLTSALMEKYYAYIDELLKQQDYIQVVNIYRQMYKLNKNYYFMMQIAKILYENLDDVQKALEVCNEVGSDIIEHNHDFCELYSKILAKTGDLTKSELYLKKAEISNYRNDVNAALNAKNWDKAVELYEKMFDLTGDYMYKIEIANIWACCYQDVKKALEMYKSLEKYLSDNSQYWYQISDLYEYYNDSYMAVLCLQKGIKLDLKELENDGNISN